MKNCLIIAGEKSGEEHAQSFFCELRKFLPEVKFWGVGGDWLQGEGVELLYHLNEFSSMGFSEVVSKIPFYLNAKKRILERVKASGTKTAILIDFQDFNLRMAGALSEMGVKVIYIVAPQAWAWREKRAEKIKKFTTQLYCILPFEKKWFEIRGVNNISIIPHPLQRRFAKELHKYSSDLDKRLFKSLGKKIKILILPGSRSKEIKYHLPIYIETIKEMKKTFEVEVVLVKSQNLQWDFIWSFIGKDREIINKAYEEDKLAQACIESDFAIATSGTITLATALFELPTIVCYRSSLFNQFIFENFIGYSGHISLPNLILNDGNFPELIQDQVTPFEIIKILKDWSARPHHVPLMREKLRKMKEMMPIVEESPQWIREISGIIGSA